MRFKFFYIKFPSLMKHINNINNKPYHEMYGPKIYFSTTIIVEAEDNLEAVLKEIMKCAIGALDKKNGKYKEGSFRPKRLEAEDELKTLSYCENAIKHSVVIFDFFDLLRRFFRKKVKIEGLFLERIGLKIYVIYYSKRGGCILQLSNSLFEPVFGNPDGLLGEVESEINH